MQAEARMTRLLTKGAPREGGNAAAQTSSRVQWKDSAVEPSLSPLAMLELSDCLFAVLFYARELGAAAFCWGTASLALAPHSTRKAGARGTAEHLLARSGGAELSSR